MYSPPIAAFTLPPGSSNREPSSLIEKSLIVWFVTCHCVESVSWASSAAEVRLLPGGFQASKAFAAVSGRFVTTVVVPAREGVVGFPAGFVVPFRPRFAQLVQSSPTWYSVLWLLPKVTPAVA